jgi:hypothetical protein
MLLGLEGGGGWVGARIQEGVSAEGVRTSISACRFQIGINNVAANRQQELLANCMEGKGFRLR